MRHRKSAASGERTPFQAAADGDPLFAVHRSGRGRPVKREGAAFNFDYRRRESGRVGRVKILLHVVQLFGRDSGRIDATTAFYTLLLDEYGNIWNIHAN